MTDETNEKKGRVVTTHGEKITLDLGPEDACIVLRSDGCKLEIRIPSKTEEDGTPLPQSMHAFALGYAVSKAEVMEALTELLVSDMTGHAMQAVLGVLGRIVGKRSTTPGPDQGGGDDDDNKTEVRPPKEMLN